MKNLIIVGAGGFGLEVAAYAEDALRAGAASYAIKGFLDDTKAAGTKHADYPVLGPTDSAIDANALYVIATGMPQGRRQLVERLKGAAFISILHPQSYIAASAHMDAGSVIAPFAFVGPMARLGAHSVLNIHAAAGHESSTGDCSVLSPYATIHGRVALGSGVFMGSHACVTAGLSIGDGAKIAAGAVVYQAIPAGATALGNPAAARKLDQ